MRLSDFDYNLPKELIAQSYLPCRSDSRLMVLCRDKKTIEHRRFSELPCILNNDDALILNDTKVFKARLTGRRQGSGGKIDILLTEEIEGGLYSALARPSRRLKDGTGITFGDGELTAEVKGGVDGFKLIRFQKKEGLHEKLERLGRVPLPPYIKREPNKDDELRYQTVYASKTGAIAAPTAGLHFTKKLLGEIADRGIETGYITLHVGYATFKPVDVEDITVHNMHKEYFEINEDAAERINRARSDGRRLVCVGTTTCRALEAAAAKQGDGYKMRRASGLTDIFIYPGYNFRAVDALLTNFHLPRTTLLMMVSAFAGRDFIMKAYQEAINERYRFYSYGDAMLIQ